MKIDAKKRAGAGERGMRVLFSALSCFRDVPIFWEFYTGYGWLDASILKSFAESFQHSELNKIQIKMT